MHYCYVYITFDRHYCLYLQPEGGLPIWAIAVIAVACLLVLGAVIITVLIMNKKREKQKELVFFLFYLLWVLLHHVYENEVELASFAISYMQQITNMAQICYHVFKDLTFAC